VTEALALQNDTIDMLEANDEEFTNKTQENTEALDEFDQQLAEIKLATLEDINKLVSSSTKLHQHDGTFRCSFTQ